MLLVTFTTFSTANAFNLAILDNTKKLPCDRSLNKSDYFKSKSFYQAMLSYTVWFISFMLPYQIY